MTLAAIYIPKNTLPYLFGDNHKEYTLNFGGEHFYLFAEGNTEIGLNLVSTNKKFIKNFWGQDISLFSSIVGRNAVGKTSILRALNHSIDPRSKKLIYLFETEKINDYLMINETGIYVSINFECTVEVKNQRLFETLYYSPSLEFDTLDTFSPITLASYFKDSLENYFLDSLTRNVNFLNDAIVDDIKHIYSDFPSYDFITIRIKKLRKSNIRSPYLEANFGNPHRGDALKNELAGELVRLKREDYPQKNFTTDDIIGIHEQSIRLLESESFTEQFNKLWEIEDYQYIDDTGYDYIHDSSEFIKNLEVNILTYLLLVATFAKTGLGGGVNFIDIKGTKDFAERINFFLEMYLVNEYKSLTDKIKYKLKKISLKDSEDIISIIREDKFDKLSGVEMKPIKGRMIKYIRSFEAIFNFYEKACQITKSKFVVFKNGEVTFDIVNTKSKLLFDELIYNYKFILGEFSNKISAVSLFDFVPNKKLSTGEKSILDFYSSIYNYIDINKESEHLNYEYYLLLLDEPDLGFHPLWKKKFINAISKTLPLLFSKINPKMYKNEEKKYVSTRENPVIQIVFTTHDPLTLSDIPNNNIIYLNKSNDLSFLVEEKDKPRKSFGANITDLLSDSFFINDGLIGEFARVKIEETINWINIQRKQKEELKLDFSINESDYQYHEKIISIIDEHVIRLKLAEMLEELKGEKKLQEELIDREIDYLKSRRANL